MFAEEFDALVLNGQLVPPEPLRMFEGQRVHVTLAIPPVPIDAKAAIEPIPELDVEKDVSVRMPFPGTAVSNPKIVQGPGLRPCLIFPEELPDD
jgi:hypothetical protein